MGYLSRNDIAELELLSPGGLRHDVNLSLISSWRIGGIAELVIQPRSTEEVASIRRWFHQRKIPIVVIGGTTNLLFADNGLRVPCLQLGPRMSMVWVEGTTVRAQAGAWVPCFVRKLMNAGLIGGEHMCGIPGTIGGLVYMNGGSQQKNIARNTQSVESVTIEGEIVERGMDACRFDYRQSVYQQNGETITSAQFQFDVGSRNEIRREILEILGSRRKKFPKKQPNCGSVFKSNPKMYAEIGSPGAVIENLRLKGKRVGGAVVSPEHANFIVNAGTAKAADILDLVKLIGDHVESATGYILECEVLYVTEQGEIRPVFVPEGS